MTLLLLIPLAVLCWIAWLAHQHAIAHRQAVLAGSLDITDRAERHHQELVAAFQSLKTDPIDLLPIADAIACLPAPQVHVAPPTVHVAAPSVQVTPPTVQVEVPVSEVHVTTPDLDLSELHGLVATLLQAIADRPEMAPPPDLSPILTKLNEWILPHLDDLSQKVTDMEYRVSESAQTRRALRLS